MTTEERTAAVMRWLGREYPSVMALLEGHSQYVEAKIRQCIIEAVEEERERCAKVADEIAADHLSVWKMGDCDSYPLFEEAQHIAAAIRESLL